MDDVLQKGALKCFPAASFQHITPSIYKKTWFLYEILWENSSNIMWCLPSPDVLPWKTYNHLDWIVIIIIIELSEKHNAFQFNKLTATIFHAFYALYNHFFKCFLIIVHILHIYLTVRQLKKKKCFQMSWERVCM